jgi:acetyltransferase-like isoleucine patch superfamily enzyme
VLRKISIPRQWSDVQIGADAALDDGVTLICSADPKPLKITIGARTYINRNTILDASDSLAIGEDCMIGPGCYLTDHDHGVVPGEAPGDQLLISIPTRIGNRVWLGAHVVILKGVTIGDDAVVAAGAVVTKDVAAGARVAGVPARPLRSQSQA